ncbi:MAG: carboxylesterase family protein [Lacunisphaera sp.]
MTHVQVKTADGVLEGLLSDDGKVKTFKGIPYAAPPVGALRWKAPQTGRAVDRRAPGGGVWSARHAGSRVGRHVFP